MRYGTDCIRMKSPVYASETGRYGSNKNDTFESTLQSPTQPFLSRRATLLLKKWLLTFELLGALRDETKTAAKETSLNVTRFVPKKVHSWAHFVL